MWKSENWVLDKRRQVCIQPRLRFWIFLLTFCYFILKRKIHALLRFLKLEDDFEPFIKANPISIFCLDIANFVHFLMNIIRNLDTDFLKEKYSFRIK